MRTVLVSMPFMSLDRPSIQLGLLKAIGEEHGFAVGTLHATGAYLRHTARVLVARCLRRALTEASGE